MVMSTRCSASLTVTPTPGAVFAATEAASAVYIYGVGNFTILQPSATPATRVMAKSLDMRIWLTSNHYLLGLIVEGDFLAGLDCGYIHAQRDRVAVACADAGVRRLARADAFHPVAHVGGGLGVAVSTGGVGVGGDLFDLVHQREAGMPAGVRLR